jgi:tRNA-specific 2-thiouridylase
MQPELSDKRTTRVVVGLSGGVDSAVAALLLCQQGYRVEAVFMKNWEEDDTQDYCPAAEDLRDAQAVADRLGIPLQSISFASEYWDQVFETFLAEYRAGRTPNPDVLCNKEIKFRAFLDYALGRGADFIATGHYARLRRDAGTVHLLKGSDSAKDQSYFLYLLDQSQLARSLFPVGDLDKSTVRRMAADAGLPNHAKKDSTGICFIGERRFRTFLSRYFPAQPGEIRSTAGKRLGRHSGLMFYTIGQRQGLGIGGQNDSTGEPWYVVEKNLAENILVVAQGRNHPRLFSSALVARNLHWVCGAPPRAPGDYHARIRYRQSAQACRLSPLSDDRWQVSFAQPQRAITPGQAVVFYRADECLGGATIDHADECLAQRLPALSGINP